MNRLTQVLDEELLIEEWKQKEGGFAGIQSLGTWGYSVTRGKASHHLLVRARDPPLET
jgi:hypothetical protein